MSHAKIHSIFHKAKHNHNYIEVWLFPVVQQDSSHDLKNPSHDPSLTSYSYPSGWTMHPTSLDIEMSSCSFSSLVFRQSLTTLRGLNLSESTVDEHAANKCGLQGCANHRKTAADSNINADNPRKRVVTACPGRRLPSSETTNGRY